MFWPKIIFTILVAHALALPSRDSTCRFLPGDPEWPSTGEWNQFNTSLGGKLIRGEPLGRSCFAPELNSEDCAIVKKKWAGEEIFINDPVNVLSRYWQNDTCNPLRAPNGTCALGNMALYAVKVTDAASAVAGIEFARQKNLRLTIKNTGHDYLGRSSGKGSLALWTHNLDSMEVLNYTSPSYSGPALRMGAGVQAYKAISFLAPYGLRAYTGYCVTIGLAGGYSQNGGYGPLGSSYGTASDQTLEFEVVTADGQHLVASSTQNSDLYWALSGGGSGNYALVLSTTVKAHTDGPIAGMFFEYLTEKNSPALWESIRLWHGHLLEFATIPDLTLIWEFANNIFRLILATWPGHSQSDLDNVFEPFLRQLESLNITVDGKTTTYEPSILAHYSKYPIGSPVPIISPDFPYPMNFALGGRIVPRSYVEADLDKLIETYQQIIGPDDGTLKAIAGASSNFSHAVAGNKPGSNAVLPAWRSALYLASPGIVYPETTPPEQLALYQNTVSNWQDLLRVAIPNSGAYVNEATYNNPNFKEDYYGENYEKLLEVKKKYDPHGVFWQHVAVGSDAYWREDQEGRLCRV